MARDIEEFLRRAAERRKQQGGGGAQKSQPAQPPRQQQPPPRLSSPPRTPRTSSASVPLEEPIIIEDVEVIEQRIQPNFKSSIDTSKISSHADALGKSVSSTHDRVDKMVHQHLDHNVGRLDDTETITDDPRPEIFGKPKSKAADELRKLLKNPKSVAQAIIMAEILKRPEF